MVPSKQVRVAILSRIIRVEVVQHQSAAAGLQEFRSNQILLRIFLRFRDRNHCWT